MQENVAKERDEINKCTERGRVANMQQQQRWSCISGDTQTTHILGKRFNFVQVQRANKSRHAE